MSILHEIVKHKHQEIQSRKRLVPEEALQKSPYFQTPTVSLSKYLKRSDKSGIIAEFKKRSPSKTNINLYADVEHVSIGYMQSGASALSILTDEKYFGGSNENLETARKFNFCPILRKDFIVDPYQIIEARSIGADAILLIASILKKDQILELTKFAHSLNLEVLLEIHDPADIKKCNDLVNIIGVNNRDLVSFNTDHRHSLNIFNQLPSQALKISESGLKNVSQIIELKQKGYTGFLIGELFMNSPDPVKTCNRFVKALKMMENQLNLV